jgi:hypothetical protein
VRDVDPSPPRGRGPGADRAGGAGQQFLLGLSDHDAAEAVRCRIDFKYALGLELDDPGFHHSVLGDFRGRLLEEGRADRLLDLARLKDAGLVRERTAQRTYRMNAFARFGNTMAAAMIKRRLGPQRARGR